MKAAGGTPLGIGIVGAGGILKRQALAYLALPNLARMVGVADIDVDRAEAARREFAMDVAAGDYRELLERSDVDVLSICTRPDSHARIIAEALEAGKHVLCEKPIARTLAEADELIAASDRLPDRRVSCLYQWRADPAVEFARDLVQQGAIGRPLMAEAVLRAWRPEAYYDGPVPRESWKLDGGGVVIVMGIHQLDTLVYLLGDVAEVGASMDRLVRPSEGEDALVGWIRFQSGALATVRFSVFDQRDAFEIQVLGRKAAVRILGEGPACSWEIEARDRSLERALRAKGRSQSGRRSRFEPSPFQVKVLERLAKMRGKRWMPPSHWWHRPFIERYLEAVRSGGEMPVAPRDARRSLELTVALYEAAITGRVVRLPVGSESRFYNGMESVAFGAAAGDRA